MRRHKIVPFPSQSKACKLPHIGGSVRDHGGAMAGRQRLLAWLGGCLGLVLVLAGCSSPPPPPGVIELTLRAEGGINPDASGRPSPVVVRVYQLASSPKFDTADFFQLFDQETATLGADLSTREEVALAPGETRVITAELKPGAQFVGLVAAFRDIDASSWRALRAVPAQGTTKLAAALSGLRLSWRDGGS
jgi:type VI secretion system protein VasD